MASIKCAGCKGTHGSVQEVRNCQLPTINSATKDEFNEAVRQVFMTQPNVVIARWIEGMTANSSLDVSSFDASTARMLSEALRKYAESVEARESDNSNDFPLQQEAMVDGLEPDAFRSERHVGTLAGPLWRRVRETGRQVPEGRYALVEEGITKFYVIERGTEGTQWAGRTFVKIQASDELHRIKNPNHILSILQAVLEDPKAAMLRYGREIGKCGHCARTLTDEESRAYGVGPVCRRKLGW